MEKGYLTDVDGMGRFFRLINDEEAVINAFDNDRIQKTENSFDKIMDSLF